MSLPIKKLSVWQCIALRLRGMAENTQRSYATDLRDFCAFLNITPGLPETEEIVASLGSREALLYEEFLRQKVEAGNLSSSTLQRRMQALKAIFETLTLEGLIERNPFRGFKGKAKDETTRKALPFDAVRQLLKSRGDSDEALQDEALLACFFGAALRRTEISNLKLEDLRLTQNGTPFLYLAKTKAQRPQEQGLPEWAAVKIARWIERRQERGATPKDPLWARILKNEAHKAGLSEWTIYRRFKTLIAEAGIDDAEYTLHEARHTAITKLVFDGVDIVRVQKFARHSNIATTMGYNHARQGIEEGAGRELDY